MDLLPICYLPHGKSPKEQWNAGIMECCVNPLFHHSGSLWQVLALSLKSFSANYVVRIYRFDKNNPRNLVGVVEEVGVKGKKAFTNYDELWEILISSKSITQKQKGNEVTISKKVKG
jgi:hypothetical protein